MIRAVGQSSIKKSGDWGFRANWAFFFFIDKIKQMTLNVVFFILEIEFRIGRSKPTYPHFLPQLSPLDNPKCNQY